MNSIPLVIFTLLILGLSRNNHISPAELEHQLMPESISFPASHLCSLFEGINSCIKDALEDPNIHEIIKELPDGHSSKLFLIANIKVWRISSTFQFTDTQRMLRSINFGLKVAYEHQQHLVGIQACCIEQIDHQTETEIRFYTEMAYYSAGNLDDFLNNTDNSQFFELTNWKWSIALQIAKGLETIHDNGYVLRNLTPKNILMADHLSIAIEDFSGLIPSTPTFFDNFVQELSVWIAPEVSSMRAYSMKSDIYSLGVVLLRVTTAVNFRSYHTSTVELQTFCTHRLSNTLYSAAFIELEFYCTNFHPIILEMCNDDPLLRPEIKTVREHIEGIFSSLAEARKQLHDVADDYDEFAPADASHEFGIQTINSI